MEFSTHEQNHILHKSLCFSNGKVKLQQDPESYSHAQMWQNVMYRQLKFEPLMMDFLQITLLLHQKVVYNILNAKQFLAWHEVVIAISRTENKIVFEYMFCAVSEYKRFDYKW